MTAFLGTTSVEELGLRSLYKRVYKYKLQIVPTLPITISTPPVSTHHSALLLEVSTLTSNPHIKLADIVSPSKYDGGVNQMGKIEILLIVHSVKPAPNCLSSNDTIALTYSVEFYYM